MQSNFWLNRTISITDQAILSTVRSKTLICLNANTNKNITLNKIEPYVSNHASVISSFKCLSLKKKNSIELLIESNNFNYRPSDSFSC